MTEELLGVTETESDAFSPRQLWFLGIDVYVSEVALEWRSPMGVWVELGTYDSLGLWQLGAPNDGVFRVTTSAAGSRVWVHK